MTDIDRKREAIRGWFDALFKEGWNEKQNDLVIDHIFKYLSSQDVEIIDKEAELPPTKWRVLRDNEIASLTQYEMKQAGFHKHYKLE